MNFKSNRTTYIVALVFTMFYTAPFFLYKQFGAMDLNQILYLFVSPPGGANVDWFLFLDYFIFTLPYIILVMVLFMLYFYVKDKWPYLQKFSQTMEAKKRTGRRVTSIFILLLVGLLLFDMKFQVLAFIKNRTDVTNLYEQYYVDPMEVEISFPQKKKNLIYIVLESLNTNFAYMEIDKEPVNLIPNLKKIAKSNLNISHNEGFGGGQQLNGLSWTMASLVGMTSGIHLKVTLEDDLYNQEHEFLPGVINIGEILAHHGYTNYFLMGSDSSFAGRETFFKTHGNYNIIDINVLKDIGFVDEDYKVFWGVEDRKLFTYAKDKLIEVAAQDEPFNFMMLSVDTHFMDGYVDEACDASYGLNYANAISCSDTLLGEFMGWLADQDFYDDTTIILVADHNTMNDGFLSMAIDERRSLYNSFLNVNLDYDPINTKHRQFSALDMFPTTLAALGAHIEGDYLGLGVNLFSGSQSLLEILGEERMNMELLKQSDYYERFYGEEYLKKRSNVLR